jgi:hypothetical protein
VLRAFDSPSASILQNEVGDCQCSNDSIEINGKCMADGLFAGIVSAVCALILAQLGWWYLGYRRRKNDEMWQVNTEELHFSYPVEVIGQGAFGVVIMAEYRGTKVAIKRVLPQQDKTKVKRSGSVALESKEKLEDIVEEEDVKPEDLEAQTDSADAGRESLGSTTSGGTGKYELDFLGGLSFGGGRQTRLQRWAPFLHKRDESTSYNMSILGTVSAGSSATSRKIFANIFPWCDEATRRQDEFKEEMRLLSRLRHPCKQQLLFLSHLGILILVPLLTFMFEMFLQVLQLSWEPS